MKNYKIAVYITAYQEKEALQKTITAITKQSSPIEKIFIVDNSKSQIIANNHQENIIVDFHPENIGVAGGLKIAVSWAIQKGYDFLWLFDQDSEPDDDVLEKLLTNYQDLSQNQNIGIIAPAIFDINTKQEFPGYIFSDYKLAPIPGLAKIKNIYQCDAVITSGSLININAAKYVELPRVDLFLDAVDYAYCMNFRKKEYKIIVIKNAMMKHRIGNYSQVKDRFKKYTNTFSTFICSPSRYYYACRNHTFFETRLVQKKFLYRSIAYRIKILLTMMERIIRYEPDSVLIKLWACIVGTFDGFRGKLGKTW
ncbi:MAG: glycosyltransferase family 2 protein [Pelatocladus maniniholoensis HA4357-MV3]|jgi:rhamnosyltransferase|uniref:Glycosyltransferase family 2 protein n=1 Tax=Pelatocladus maniniholoensis HA4357-MV3 TaxID=1117104 RepID=A0A9E3HB93_9NOST|nr:glycosyltransferase family 2 protein [Pelatocladus maniniholoensis HA4357-MV3]BAZ68731.1 glycosyl transferase family protein [Fischerella sp. NIES-4106]